MTVILAFLVLFRVFVLLSKNYAKSGYPDYDVYWNYTDNVYFTAELGEITGIKFQQSRHHQQLPSFYSECMTEEQYEK